MAHPQKTLPQGLKRVLKKSLLFKQDELIEEGMRGDEQLQEAMFSYGSLSQRVPMDHPLRRKPPEGAPRSGTLQNPRNPSPRTPTTPPLRSINPEKATSSAPSSARPIASAIHHRGNRSKARRDVSGTAYGARPVRQDPGDSSFIAQLHFVGALFALE